MNSIAICKKMWYDIILRNGNILQQGGYGIMPNIKSAKKRVLVTASKSAENKAFKTALKTVMKKYEAAIASGDKALAAETYKAAVKKIDKAVAKGILHKNAAARKKSQFTTKLNAINA